MQYSSNNRNDFMSINAEKGSRQQSAAYFQTTRKRWSDAKYQNNYQSMNRVDYSWRRRNQPDLKEPDVRQSLETVHRGESRNFGNRQSSSGINP